MCWTRLLLLVSAVTAAPATQPVMDLLVRVVGVDAAAQFDLSLDSSLKQGFRASTSNSSSTAVRVAVVGSDLPELAYGCAYYLRTAARMSFAWERAGGNQVSLPARSGGGGVALPALAAPLTRTKKARWTYYQNVCTQSYSMWWWGWDRWEREIDWMALWGVNLVLAYTGQEAVFREVYNGIGVDDDVLNATFNGPAFLTWSRGQGSFGVGGPLPNFWIEAQAALQTAILARLRELHISAILPGFQGNVPMAMPSLFPAANTSGGWLDAADPLFKTIAHGVGAGMRDRFGNSGFVEADGWFSLQTGPWLGSFGEAEVAANWDGGGGGGGAAVAEAGVSAEADALLGSCLRGFRIPSEEEAFVRARTVFAAITAADPAAVWVYQGYPWFRVYSQGAACNQTALRLFVRGFTRGIPEDRLLVLDLVADSPGRALWRYPVDDAIGPFAQNASLIWCALNNWGGAVHLGGDMSYVLNETRAALAAPAAKTVGVGLTPEGIDNSPAYFSLVLDAPWTTQPTAASWLQEWGAGRCGAAVAEAEQAYALLSQTVYRPGKPYLWCCSQPRFCPTVLPAGASGAPARPDYNITLLRRALELMVAAAPRCDTAAFRYDLVDVAREWLSMAPCLAAYDGASVAGLPAAQLVARVAALADVTADIDAMMGADAGFLLGSWLKDSRAVSAWDGSAGALAGFYEWNSRVQITTWAGAYSRREWSGMVTTYYNVRTQIWLNWTLDSANAAAAAASAATANPAEEAGFSAFPGHDCNFDDDGRATACTGARATAACIAAACNATAGCVAFNVPHGYLKQACTHYQPVAATTAYIRDGHVPFADGYDGVPNWDCNFNDVGTAPQCGAVDIACLGRACNATAGCIGFNSPGRILKSACDSPEASPGSTMFLTHTFPAPPGEPRSACVGGFCSRTANGTFAGLGCGGTCPAKPVTPLATLLSAFDVAWQNMTWTEAALPSVPVGDPVAMAAALLAKYK